MEDRLGSPLYLAVYLLLGALAGLVQCLISASESVPLIGASGAIAGVLGIYFIAYPTAFVRTAALRSVGGFNHNYQYVSDYDLWLRLARRYSLKFIAEPLAKYRIHESQFTQ